MSATTLIAMGMWAPLALGSGVASVTCLVIT